MNKAKTRAAEREAAREANPQLSVFDTGEMLEPKTEDEEQGTVVFTDEHGQTLLSVYAHPSMHDDDTIILGIDTFTSDHVKIVVNDGGVATIRDGGESPTVADDAQLCAPLVKAALALYHQDRALPHYLRSLIADEYEALRLELVRLGQLPA